MYYDMMDDEQVVLTYTTNEYAEGIVSIYRRLMTFAFFL